MDTVTLTPPAPVPRFALQPPPADGPPGARARRSRSARSGPARDLRFGVAVGLLLVATFVLRLWGVKQGLPYSYNVDEATHFVPRAISFFSSDLNPHYFLNPPAYSYLLTIVYELWFGSADAVVRAYTLDPTAVFIVARVVAAVLGTLAVWLTYLAGAKLLNRSAALLGAAIFGFAFLPVFYSHLALNDVPALAPVALAMLGLAGVYRDGRGRDYVIAGIGIGLAAATKYTGGITLVCLLAAVGCDARVHGSWRALRWLAAGLIAALVAFTLGNPYWILDWKDFTAGISSQASLAAGSEPVKLGTTPGGGVGYYLWTFSWGFGLGPALAALAGAAALLVRRRWGLAAILLPAPVAFIIFMGSQQRYFGRWLMPIFPLVALLGGYAAVELVRWLHRSKRLPLLAGGALAALLLLTQSVVADVHDDQVLSRPDTRNLVRAWMVKHVPAGSKVVIEPVVPTAWPTDVGVAEPWTPTGQRWYQYPTWLTYIGSNGKPLPAGDPPRYVTLDQYERVLRPSLIPFYESKAYCWVVTGSLQAGRAFADPGAAPGAIAYYAALARASKRVYSVSPFAPGAAAVPFGFDWSIDYYPRQYRLPGPSMTVYHLLGGRCASSGT